MALAIVRVSTFDSDDLRTAVRVSLGAGTRSWLYLEAPSLASSFPCPVAWYHSRDSILDNRNPGVQSPANSTRHCFWRCDWDGRMCSRFLGVSNVLRFSSATAEEAPSRAFLPVSHIQLFAIL